VVNDVKRWRSNLQLEIDGAAIYYAMARVEPDANIAALYRRLAIHESRHARGWIGKLRGVGEGRRFPRPSWRATLLIVLARRLGPDFVGRSLAARERWERATYEAQDDAATALLGEDERLHARILGHIARAKLSGPGMARLSNSLRAAVLGVTDGLVSNVSLVMGVAGAGGDTHTITIAGFAGLLAGSLSMAMGEWLSVQTSRELFIKQVMIERDKVEAAPEAEADEIALIYASQGMPVDEAQAVARQLVHGSHGTGSHASSDPDGTSGLAGSAWTAAFMSFGFFAFGAALPLLPFAFLGEGRALIASGVITGAVLFVIGSAITSVTGQPAIRSGVRQLAIGAGAAAVTYGLGRLFGAAVG
jgi:VIT1/CCC1 family predicted Fe2+/Mn2+ transporter